MITLLAKLIIPNYQKTSDSKVRESYGILSGVVGICLNVCLFTGKFIAGLMSGAISITADAFNNLSDAGSSIVTLLGFKLAAQKPDTEHPYGHGRLEYVSGLIVSMFIVVMGVELIKSSIAKIFHPTQTEFSTLIAVILLCSIAVKLYMFYYNSRLSAKLNSVAMHSTAADSLSDTIATTVVLVSSIFTKFTGINIDGFTGLAVSVFIIYSGVTSAIDTINPLLGQPPTAEYVEKVCKVVTSYKGILGVHDFMSHDYGPGRRMISLHAEVPADMDILVAHDMIDNIEMRLEHEFGVNAVIHMDPISVNDPETNALRAQVSQMILALDSGLSFHDFRIVKGQTHTNVLFDVVAPYECKFSDEEIVSKLKEQIKGINPHYHCIINVDKKYI